MNLLKEIRINFNGGYDSVYLMRDGDGYTVHNITRWTDSGNFYKSGKLRFADLDAAHAEARALAQHLAHVLGGAGEPHTTWIQTPAVSACNRAFARWDAERIAL